MKSAFGCRIPSLPMQGNDLGAQQQHRDAADKHRIPGMFGHSCVKVQTHLLQLVGGCGTTTLTTDAMFSFCA